MKEDNLDLIFDFAENLVKEGREFKLHVSIKNEINYHIEYCGNKDDKEKVVNESKESKELSNDGELSTYYSYTDLYRVDSKIDEASLINESTDAPAKNTKLYDPFSTREKCNMEETGGNKPKYTFCSECIDSKNKVCTLESCSLEEYNKQNREMETWCRKCGISSSLGLCKSNPSNPHIKYCTAKSCEDGLNSYTHGVILAEENRNSFCEKIAHIFIKYIYEL